jgi:hypothetical protein
MITPRTVRYGEPDVLSDERFLVRAEPSPDVVMVDGRPTYPSPYVLLRDEQTGEFWHLSKGAAHQLGVALQALAKVIRSNAP